MSNAFIGHKRQVEYLNKALQKGRLAHAYLFYGPEEVGKFTFANNFASSLVIPYYRGETSIVILSPESPLVSKKDKRKDIPIEDMRELKRKFSLAPEAGKWRVAIIDQADKMSQEASNGFLKLLEEPGEKTLFILISSAIESVLPTVVSRTQPIRFSLVSEGDMEDLARQKTEDAEAQKTAIWFAAGRPGRLCLLLEKKDNLEREKLFLKELIQILNRQDLGRAFLLSEKVAADGEKMCKITEYILRLIRGRMLQGPIKPPPIALAQKIKAIHRIYDLFETTNVNPRLALDAIFLKAIN